MKATPGTEWWRTEPFSCPKCGNEADDGFHSASLGGEEAVSCEECDHVFIPQKVVEVDEAAERVQFEAEILMYLDPSDLRRNNGNGIYLGVGVELAWKLWLARAGKARIRPVSEKVG